MGNHYHSGAALEVLETTKSANLQVTARVASGGNRKGVSNSSSTSFFQSQAFRD